MKAVWITDLWRDTVWALLHHINIRMDKRVKTPGIGISGTGGAARLNILLPSPEPPPPEGLFRVTVVDGKLDVTGGFLLRNGEMLAVPAKTGITATTGYLCVASTVDDRGWSDPELKIATPAPDAFPVAEIKVSGSAVTVIQFPVAVAVIMLTKLCPFSGGVKS